MSCFYECFQGKQLQHGFNSLQKLRKSVSGALGVALGSRRFDLEHEPMLEEPEQNWFLTKSAPNSLSNPLLYHHPLRTKVSDDNLKDESLLSSDKVIHITYLCFPHFQTANVFVFSYNIDISFVYFRLLEIFCIFNVINVCQ